jgi:hypothetical protein
VSIAAAFADIARDFSAAGLGAFYDASARWPGAAIYDEGGSIDTAGDPIVRSCQAQVDEASEAMRREDGFRDSDARILVLCATLDGALDADAIVDVAAGPGAGAWSLQSVRRDPCGICWDCRGRKV